MKIVFSFLLFFFSVVVHAQNFYVVGAVSGKNGLLSASSVEATKLTHVIYKSVGIIHNRVAFKDSSSSNDIKNLNTLKELKLVNPKLKVLISIGGEQNGKEFKEAASTEESRELFTASVISFIKKHQLDGIELDWVMTPKGKFQNMYDPNDHYNYALLIDDLRFAMNEVGGVLVDGKLSNYVLCVTGSHKRQYLMFSKFRFVIDQIDFITLQTFSYKVEILSGGGVSPSSISGHHTNMFASRADAWPRRSADETIKEYKQHGINANKLVLGIAAYGQEWTNVHDEQHGLCQMTDGRINGDIPYKNISTSYLKNSAYKKYWDKDAKASYLFNEEKKQFVSYEDKKSIRKKTKYVRKHKLAGVVFNECQQDENSHLLKGAKQGLSFIRLPL